MTASLKIINELRFSKKKIKLQSLHQKLLQM